MQKIWIWNSIAHRRRSASDTFEENGIQILKSFLNRHGYTIEIIDWATNESYNSLSCLGLQKLNYLFIYLSTKCHFIKKTNKLIQFISYKLQNRLEKVLKKNMKKKLRNLALKVAKNNIRIFGIKLWYGDAYTWAKYLTKLIHKYSPQTVIVGGGYHATLYEEDILKYSDLDLVVSGEGEYIFLKIIKFASNFISWDKDKFINNLINDNTIHSMNGLIYRKENEIIKIPRIQCEDEIILEKDFPIYDRKSSKVKVHILTESLGCPWNKCYFCVHNKFVPKYRFRQTEDIISEIKSVIRQGIGLFRFAGSDTPPHYGQRIAEAILENNIIIEFTMGSRAISNSKDSVIFNKIVENYSFMIRAGLKGVFIGCETGNDVINDRMMNKGLCKEDIIYTVKAIRKAEILIGRKIAVSLAFIYPTPLSDGITDKDVVEENLKLIELTQPDSVIISPPAPFKNSYWNKEKSLFGFEINEDFISSIIDYEYVLFKPLDLWPDLPIKMNGKSFKEILHMTQNFKELVKKKLDIPLDLSDELFLMINASGLNNKTGIKKFHRKSLLSIVSCNYSFLNRIAKKVSNYSTNLARLNNFN